MVSVVVVVMVLFENGIVYIYTLHVYAWVCICVYMHGCDRHV